MNLNQSLEIVRLACELGLDPAGDTAGTILRHCHQRVASWLAANPAVREIGELETLVCQRLNLDIVEARSRRELAELCQRLANEGDPIFASLPDQFDEATYATLIRRRQPDTHGRTRYVAVLDCRPAKVARRFFTRWHEIAHLLTQPGLLPGAVHRSLSDHSPLERLMDAIAADLGFFDPFFRPLLEAEIAACGRLTLAGVERIRARFNPGASYQATLSASVARASEPLLLLEAGLGFSRAEEKQFDDEPIPARRPKPSLRLLRVVANDAARNRGFHLRRNSRVPAASLLHRVFFHNRAEPLPADALEGCESLRLWRPGVALVSDDKMLIQARPQKHTVLALASLAEP